jgi:magnesium-transporting ATPase (P-type)
MEWIDYSAETAQKSVGVFEANNLVFAGSSCRTGEALGLVIRTGNSMVNFTKIQLINSFLATRTISTNDKPREAQKPAGIGI